MLKKNYIAGVVIALAVILLAVIFPIPVRAWMRMPYEDAVVAGRSEVIVVARLKRDSIKYVPHKRKPHEGRSWEHHAVLIVSEVLKGKLKEREIPIVIHYGLTPVVGGYVKRDGFMMNLRLLRKDYPKDVIEIFDTGGMSFSPCLTNAGKDNLWFLRKRSGLFGSKPGTGNYGIVDPQDVQPLLLKGYFLSYLAKDSEKAVKEYVAKHPNLAKRAERHLDHLEIERILKIADVKTRTKRLLPYYVKRHWYRSGDEAEAGILACGETAMPHLMKLFENSADPRLRSHIIQTWAKLKSKTCVNVLIDVLKRQDKFWAKQELKSGWWNTNVDSELNRRLRDASGEVHHAVVALEQIGDPRAREAIEITKRRWEAISFSDPQIIEGCDRALRAFAKAQKPAARMDDAE